jgi:hypothetical protein
MKEVLELELIDPVLDQEAVVLGGVADDPTADGSPRNTVQAASSARQSGPGR